MEVSVAWYEKVLGLKKVQLPAWGPFPIFMLTGKTGVALFPAKLDDPELTKASRNVRIEHSRNKGIRKSRNEKWLNAEQSHFPRTV